MIVSLLQDMFREVGMVVRHEMMTVDGTQRRMDLVVYTATRTFWFDVSVVNPMCETYAGMNAIEVRRSQKEGKWKKHADKQGVVFRALVFDAFGGTGPDVEKTLATIAAKAHQQAVHPCGSPSRWRAEYRAQLRCRLVTALAYANHLMVEEAIAASRQGHFAPGRALKHYRGLHSRLWFMIPEHNL